MSYPRTDIMAIRMMPSKKAYNYSGNPYTFKFAANPNKT